MEPINLPSEDIKVDYRSIGSLPVSRINQSVNHQHTHYVECVHPSLRRCALRPMSVEAVFPIILHRPVQLRATGPNSVWDGSNKRYLAKWRMFQALLNSRTSEMGNRVSIALRFCNPMTVGISILFSANQIDLAHQSLSPLCSNPYPYMPPPSTSRFCPINGYRLSQGLPFRHPIPQFILSLPPMPSIPSHFPSSDRTHIVQSSVELFVAIPTDLLDISVVHGRSWHFGASSTRTIIVF